MVKLKNKAEYIEYIKANMIMMFANIKLLNYYYEEADGRFGIYFEYKDDKILISSERAYLGLNIERGIESIEVNQLDEQINNMILSIESIDYYISFLKNFYTISTQNCKIK